MATQNPAARLARARRQVADVGYRARMTKDLAHVDNLLAQAGDAATRRRLTVKRQALAVTLAKLSK